MTIQRKCADCSGQRRKIRKVPSTMYKCGFITEAYTCPTCNGTGEAPALTAVPSGLLFDLNTLPGEEVARLAGAR